MKKFIYLFRFHRQGKCCKSFFEKSDPVIMKVMLKPGQNGSMDQTAFSFGGFFLAAAGFIFGLVPSKT